MKTITISMPDTVRDMYAVLLIVDEDNKSWGMAGMDIAPEDGKFYEFRVTKEENKDGT